MYGRAFHTVIPSIYDSLGLVNYQAGLMEAVRSISSGLTSMGSGFFTDIFQHRRVQILAISMALIGIGYFLVAISPTYVILLFALLLPSAGAALWHPPALGMLAQRFPQHRGLMVSLHRSTGNVGDAIAPIIVGALLGVVSWRWVMGGGSPMLILLAVLILLFLPNVWGQKPQEGSFGRNTKAQLRSLREAFKGGRARGILPIFTVSALHGMGDRAFLWLVPLYLVGEGVLLKGEGRQKTRLECLCQWVNRDQGAATLDLAALGTV
jgi:MFS family permease